jgi:serine protease Do
MAKPIYESLVKTGKVVRGYLGIGLQDLNQDLATSFSMKDSKGALVSDVKEDSPADQAGLKQGDVIIEYQGILIEDGVALQRMVTRTPVGSEVPVKVMRDGRARDLTVRVGEQPELEKAAKKVESGEHDYALAGLSVEDLNQNTARELGIKGKAQGVVVTSVDPDSGAERAGLVPGDVIQEVNQRPVKSVKEFEKVSSDLKKGDSILMLVNRRGGSLFLSAKI